jgi:tetratricopeptide (TPR) repeat protein
MTNAATSSQLSLCMIVKNEANHLARCLKSAKPWVKEMVVVDTGSTDTTISIAKELGAKVHHFSWSNNFAAARNYSLSLATGEWILVLDADEEFLVTANTWEPLSLSSEILACQINLRDADASEGLTAMHATRLFRNLPGLEFTSRFHEYLVYKGQPLTVEQLQPFNGAEILHYGYSQTALAQKSAGRIAFLENIRQQDGLSLMLLWTLSGFYDVTGKPEALQGCYDEAWERLLPNLMTGEPPSEVRAVPAWMYFLATQALKQQDQETAQLLAQAGLKWFPNYPPFYYLSGRILSMIGFSIGAKPYLQACLQFEQTGHYFKTEPFEKRVMTVLPAHDLGCIALEQHQFAEAAAYFEQVLRYQPDHASAQALLEQAKQYL